MKAAFDQRGQNVNSQTNVAGDAYIAMAQNRTDLVSELVKLKAQITDAHAQGVLSKDIATDAKEHITKAVEQAKKQNPDKQTILDHINGGKALIEGVSTATSLITGFIEAAEIVRKFFA